ncbi:MAG: hypothetical protein ACJAWS_000984 [Oleiphilaceae bacterium]
MNDVSGPSQPKVEDEQWSDDRIKGFLSLKPLDGSSHDYHVLSQAYQHMTPAFFDRFLAMFVAEGRDLNAKSIEDKTILTLVSEHRRSVDYLKALNAKGA